MAVQLSSTAFKRWSDPQQYTCDGEDQSPPLHGAASGQTKSLALICDDLMPRRVSGCIGSSTLFCRRHRTPAGVPSTAASPVGQTGRKRFPAHWLRGPVRRAANLTAISSSSTRWIHGFN